MKWIGFIMKSKSVMLATALAFAFAPMFGSAQSAAQSAAPSGQVSELLDIFNRGCLHALAAGSLASFATGLQGAPLSRDDFARAVPDKTGEGWAIGGKAGKYVLLHSQGFKPGDIALLPNDKNEVCTVTTTGPKDLALLEPFRALKAQFAAETHTTLLKPTHPASIQGVAGTPSVIEMQVSATLSSLLYVQSLQPNGDTEYRLEYRPSPYAAKP